MATETWYVLEGGAAVDPAEVAHDNKGVLRHKSGAAIAMRGQVPSTRGVDPEEERKKAAAKTSNQPAAPEVKQVKADDPKPAYRTRESKSE